MGKCEQCIIKQFNALKSLTKDELVRISKCKTSKTISKGDIIFEEGESINGIFCVKDGICKLSKLGENGKDQIVKLVVKGSLIGQRSLVTNQGSNLKAMALSDMEVCFIPRNEIIADLQKNPKFTLNMLEDMAHNLKESDDIIVNMAQKTVKQRLAETLIYVHNNFGVNPDGTLSLVISREIFANIVGTATESAIRILSKFKKEGLISTHGKHIKIENLNGLKQVE